LRDHQERHGESWFIRKEGDGFPVSFTASALPLSQSEEMGAVVLFNDISDRKREEQRVKHLAHHDPLTGLPNRALLDDRLAQALAVAKRDGLHLSLMFLDLDKFKPINDTHGHHVGDLLLVEVARRLQQCLRDSDTAGRIGGDEFVVLLPNINSLADAVIVANKILSELQNPCHLNGINVEISASIGVATTLGHDCDAMKLKSMADAAMYLAKESGRSTVAVYRTEELDHNWHI
jgi:diguanylate cyclase (GGDEF)-like protein